MRKPDLSKLSFAAGVPTMIVPPGTQIELDPQGQVSIRTPGNLVLQNSGAYAVLESVSGSIRIEPSVHVEAVTVRCADTCFVQGKLTAWRLVARTLHVDADAEAQVVMQETEHLEVERNGRVVGNFRSEKELFQLFSRFSNHVRALPAPVPGERSPESVVEAEIEAAELTGELTAASGNGLPPSGDGRPPSSLEKPSVLAELPDPLCLALLLLDQIAGGGEVAAGERRVHEHIIRLLREGDLETLRHTYKTLFARLGDDPAVRRARRLVGSFFDPTAPPLRPSGAGGEDLGDG